METVDELVNIENKGDSDAKLSYKVISSRILDSEINGELLEDNSMLTDSLSHDYPFHVNIDLSKKYISSGGNSSTFEVSVSWPLDSGNDKIIFTGHSLGGGLCKIMSKKLDFIKFWKKMKTLLTS